MHKTHFAVVTLLVAAVAYVGPAAVGQERKLLDYEKIQTTAPRMQELSDEGSDANHKLHGLLDRLNKSDSEQEQIDLREEIRLLLVTYIDVKRQMIAVTKDVLEIGPTGMTDQEVFDRLHETELRGIDWRKRSFRRCIADIARELNIRIRMQFSVVQRNTVECEFKKVPAETLLAWLCNGFDLKYVIHDGEVIVYKKITPTEERFLDYKARHPDVELRYWDKEDASGEYKGVK